MTPSNRSNLPITNSLYGKDHPKYRKSHFDWEPTEHMVRVGEHVRVSTLKALATAFPKSRTAIYYRRKYGNKRS